MDVLLKMGMPARIKGLTYICDAVELFDTDPYYPDGKICTLYSAIAAMHRTTAASVERAIRHAFETTLAKGDAELLEQYLDMTNTQNSNLLRSLYFHIKQGDHPDNRVNACNPVRCPLNGLYNQEALDIFCHELALAVAKHLKAI